MPRMQILSADEYTAFKTPPIFNSRERKHYFNFPKSLLEVVQTFRVTEYRVFFLGSCGYFRATKRFFSPKYFHQRDIEYVMNQLDLSLIEIQDKTYADRARQRYQKLILEFYGFQSFDAQAEKMLNVEITTMIKTYLKPKLMFEHCIDFLIQNRVQVPRARTLTDLIRLALQTRKAELIHLIEMTLSDKTRHLLDDLLIRSQDENRYKLTLLKKLNQSTQPTRIKARVVDFGTLQELYQQLKKVLVRLNLGHAGIRYYAGSVIRSKIFQIKQRAEADQYIHVMAFIAHQFYRIQDNLVDSLLNVIATFRTRVSREHKEYSYEQRKDHHKRLKHILHELDESVLALIQSIQRVTENEALSDTEKINQIKRLLQQKTETENLVENLKADMLSADLDQTLYTTQEKQSIRLQNRISPILKALTFQISPTPLKEALDYFKAKDGIITDKAPLDFLEADKQKVLFKDDGSFRPSLYKVFLFQQVAEGIKSGHLNLKHSYKYRPMDTYLISTERWKREKLALIKRAGLEAFLKPKPVLEKLDHTLYEQYQRVNNRAKNNENSYLKWRSHGQFHVLTPALDEAETDPLQACFPERHYVPLAEVLETVNSHCAMLDAFQHWQQTHTRQALSRSTLLAGIMSLGCRIGVRKMSRISSPITENELEHAVNWYFSLENLREANDCVLKAMDSMALPNTYRREQEQLHTASDGQKFEVNADSLFARRSYKYFGKEQGVSAYTFVDERHFLWHSLVISASDRESAYVIDGLMHNDVIKSTIHSTDTHGYSEAIFGLTHLLGFSFAPRIKNLKKQSLYLFRSRKQVDQSEWQITPDKYINDQIILEHWDDLLRLVTTIKLKETTASDIFKRLNSYSKQHVLYRALKAFGQIIKSLFILRYIDDVELRQAVEKQLNKVELSNRFTRAVAVGHPREFTQAEKEELEVAESCNRLIKNSIICWNYLYLERQLKQAKDQETRDKLLQSLTTHSVMTWAHINMLGEYDFAEEKLKDSVGILPPQNRGTEV